jgi:hypothetical protein
MKRPLHYAGQLLLLVLITSLLSCERLSELYRLHDTIADKHAKGPDKKDNTEDPCGVPVVIPLVSRDQPDFSPGQVTVMNDDENLTVKFEITEADWNVDMIYLQVGPLDLVPLDETGSYPAFWDFQYQYADVPVSCQTFQVPLENLDECFLVLAQARVVDSQGNVAILWTEGANPDWTAGPFYTEYCIEICNEDTSDTDPA